MGVDYYTCNHCVDTFPDCCTYYTCEDCWTHWCSEECAEKDDAIWDDGEIVSCKYCRHEDLEDISLIAFMLKHYKVDRATIVRLYYEQEDNK